MANLTPKQVLGLAQEKKATYVDMKFIDFIGLWQHFTIPLAELTEDVFEEGLGFDGSSIRGWQAINASDMLVMPDPTTAVMDPFMAEPTLSLICNIVDPITQGALLARPAQHRAQGREVPASRPASATSPTSARSRSSSSSTTSASTQAANQLLLPVDSVEGQWNTGRDEESRTSATSRATRKATSRSPPTDSQQDIRTEMCRVMEKVGIEIERQHHEVATAGQAEIDMRFDPLVKMATSCMWFKYIIKNVARRHGKTVTFMPKPLFGDNGSGMHMPPVALEGRQAALRRRRATPA